MDFRAQLVPLGQCAEYCDRKTSCGSLQEADRTQGVRTLVAPISLVGQLLGTFPCFSSFSLQFFFSLIVYQSILIPLPSLLLQKIGASISSHTLQHQLFRVNTLFHFIEMVFSLCLLVSLV